LNNFIENLTIKRDNEKFKEKAHKTLETENFALNFEVFQEKNQFLDYFQWLQIKELNVYKGIVGIVNSEVEIMIKIKIKEEKNVSFKAIYNGNNEEIVRFLIENLVFLTCL